MRPIPDTSVDHTGQPATSSPSLADYNPERVRGQPVPGNTKPSLTIEEAAQQLARYGISLAGSGVYHQPVTVTYSYRSAASLMPDDTGGFSRFSAAQIAATEMALAAWADVANIKFVRVGSGTQGDAAYSNSAIIRFANYATGAAGAAAFAFLPGATSNNSSSDSDVWVNGTLDYNAVPVRGDYGQQVLVHEIGHALGLEHPSDYNAGDTTADLTYQANASYFEDSRQYTLMSYFGGVNTGAAFPAFSATPGMDDIAAIQLLYGANMNSRVGDTVYGFNSNADQVWFKSVAADGSDLVFCAWDAGGNDTFDFSGYALNAFIDLRAAHFSNVGTGVANVSIAAGVTIENAIGGTGADRIVGNDIANHLVGNAGADVLDGGLGADSLDGGIGDDTYYVDNAGDTTVELANQGTDTVFSSVTYSVAATYVEILTLTGSGNLNASGNGLSNTLNGNSGANILDGSVGADTMAGGLGDDTYIVDNAGDVVTEAADAGTDTVQSSVAYTLGDNVENLVILAGDITGTGNALNNTLTSSILLDTLAGGLGDDTYIVNNLGDIVIEGFNQGTDTVFASTSYSAAITYVENITLTGDLTTSATGNGLNNVLTGNANNNILNGSVGADTLIGGLGSDYYYVDNVGDSVVENTDEGTDLVYALISYNLTDAVENVALIGAGDLNASGNDLNNFVFGQGGDNILNGGGGTDFLFGQGGNDYLDGGTGFDGLYGGSGNDTYIVDNYVDGANEQSTGTGIDDGGIDIVMTSVNYILGGFIENLTQTGTDNIVGVGNDLANIIIGNTGNNTFDGGTGNDTLTGGLGADAFVFNLNSGADTVTDFDAAQGDILYMHAYSDTAHTITQVGADTQISFDNGNVITVLNTTATDSAFLSHLIF